MNALGKYCHDFPRLAKESGYMFQLYRGRINWSDLDKVNVQEIIDERNFQLLEQNLIHVINCNLEREYDVKILDQNFVKLFKLAQLGIDYLSYCELYLDRCVILLQEQLASFQEECALLKEENEKKDEELKKSKKLAKAQSQKYKCSKCSKRFLNETYLESHEKRRHKNTSESNQSKQLSFSDQAQQTETEKASISVFTQTIDNAKSSVGNESAVSNEKEVLKRREQELKIDNLKRDLEELKIRLSLAEKTMEEKRNDERTYPSSFPSTVIPVIHSYISPTCNGHVPMISATPTVIPTMPNQLPVREEMIDNNQENLKKTNNPESNEFSMYSGNIFRQTSVEETPGQKFFTPERVPAEGASTVRSGSVNSNETVGNIYEGLKDDAPHAPPQRPYSSSDNHVMDVMPKGNAANEDATKNLPKKPKPQLFLEVENLTNDFPLTITRSSPVFVDSDLKLESESPSDSLEPRTSTPVTSTHEGRGTENDTKWGTETNFRDEKRERRRKSQATSARDMKSFDSEGKSKSFFRKIVKKKSPKIQELKVNLKNSFSQLYGSVSSVGKKSLDDETGIELGKTKSDILENLHKRLRDLGIDPEWSGIPKETMKQKLNILEHNRNLSSKESRLYPYLRRKLQKHVLKKLKNHSLPSKGKVQISTESLDLDVAEQSGAAIAENVMLGETSEITFYDTDRDSDLERTTTKDDKPIPLSAPVPPNKAQNVSLDSIEPAKLSLTSPGEAKWGEGERETTDFSIFQAGKFKSSKVKDPDFGNRVFTAEKPRADVIDELETDSDFDDELFNELERENARYMPNRSPQKDAIASFPARTVENAVGEYCGSAKIESQSILKSEIDNKSQLMTKKKVLFAEEPEVFESTSKAIKFAQEKQKIFDLSSIVDDDDWSMESECTVNKAP